jgi:2'-5' RNA ligase
LAMHYFLAIALPDHIKQTLDDWRQQYQHQLPFQSWVHPEDYHITLVFLGSAAPASLHTIQKKLETAAAGWAPFELRLKGLQTFGIQERPRVLWVDVTHPDELFIMQKEVHTICDEAGFSLETRPYRPHITAARRWIGEHSLQDLQTAETEALHTASFAVTQVVLYETHPTSIPKYKENFKIILQRHHS